MLLIPRLWPKRREGTGPKAIIVCNSRPPGSCYPARAYGNDRAPNSMSDIAGRTLGSMRSGTALHQTHAAQTHVGRKQADLLQILCPCPRRRCYPPVISANRLQATRQLPWQPPTRLPSTNAAGTRQLASSVLAASECCAVLHLLQRPRRSGPTARPHRAASF